MRKLILIIIVLSYTIIGVTQDSWYRDIRYEDDVPVTAFHMLTTETEVYVSGKANCTDSLGQLYSCTSVAKHDYNGNVLWWTYLPWVNSANEVALSLIDDTLIMTGHSISRANNRLVIDFFNIDGTHIKTDEINYDSIYHEGGFFNNGQILLERHLYIQCETGKFLDGVTTTVTTKYNIDTGEYTHWDVHKDPIGTPSLAGRDFCLDIDSNFVISSEINAIGGDLGRDIKQITKFDNQGNIIDKFYGPDYDMSSSVSPEMVVMKDGRYIILHNINEFIQVDVPQFACIDPMTKDICWTYDYTSKLDTNRRVNIFQLSVAKNGDIIGSGSENTSGSPRISDYYLFRISSDGEMLWQRTFVRQDESDNYLSGGFRDVQELSDDSILAIGSNGDGYIGMMRLSADGCLMNEYCEPLNFLGGMTSVSEIVENQLQLYPNPVTDIVSLTLDSATKALLSIISSDGRVVLEKWFSPSGAHSIDLDVSDFPVGLYNIIVSQDTKSNQLTSTAKFVKI